MLIGILEPSDFSLQAIKLLKSVGKVELFDGKNLEQFVKNKTVLFVRLNYSIDEVLLSKAKSLQYICSPTTGLNHIDTTYCAKRHIQIMSLKGETRFLSTIRATPEHTLGLILALRRHYSKSILSTSNKVWNREPYKGYEIFESKIGIIGYGRVGKILAKYLKAMGAQVAIMDIVKQAPVKGIKVFKTIEGLINWSDTVVLCANYDQSQGEIIHRTHFKALQDKYFINTARAELTDETSLVELAASGHFKGLAIDVITEEQTSQKHLQNLLQAAKHFNIIVTPHIGGATYSSMCRTEEFITHKLLQQFEKQ